MTEGLSSPVRLQTRELLRSGEIEALLAAIAAGQQARLAELYDRCNRQVFALALRPVVFEVMSISGSSAATFAAVHQ